MTPTPRTRRAPAQPDAQHDTRVRRAVAIALLSNPEGGQAVAVKTIAKRWGLEDAEIRKALPGLEAAC